MRALEFACFAIVALYVALRVRGAEAPARVVSRLALLAAAGWVGEDSVIRAYGFYSYSRGWSVFLDRTPLLIVAIWPVVVDSAGELARRLVGARAAWLPIVGGAIVLADASLIEPIAVHARLWSWTEPGLFDVPLIGILGWAFFAASALAWIERCDATGAKRARAGVVLAAPVATHVLLVVSWWGAFKWVSGAIGSWAGVMALCPALALAAAVAWRTSLRARVPLSVLMMRLPGAGFFFVLLALYGRDAPALVVWTLVFVPPYLALVRVERRGTFAPLPHRH